MKKQMLIALSLLCLCLLLSACSSAPANAPAADMSSRFEAVYTKIEANFPEMMEIPQDMVLDYYGIDPADYSAGFFMISVDNMLADEIVMLQAVDGAAADRLEGMLEERLQAKAEEAESYSPEQFAVISACRILRDGQTLALIVSPEFSSMADTFKQETHR